MKRNITENRLTHKVSKRDITASNSRLINDGKKYRCVSNEGEITFDNYIKIDNSNLEETTVAEIIKKKFDL